MQLSNKSAENSVRYSSVSSLPSVGLWRSGFVFFAGTRREGLGLPTRSRAISRTTLAAEKIFFFGLRGMIVVEVRSRPSNCSRQKAGPSLPHPNAPKPGALGTPVAQDDKS